MLIDLTDDVKPLLDYIATRVQAQMDDPRPVSAIEVGFRLCQVGMFVIHFDTRDIHQADGEWTMALDGPTIEFPHWQAACEAEDGVTFILLDGSKRELPPGCNDVEIGSTIGGVLRSVTLDAVRQQVLAPLNLRDDCELDVEEFEGIWAWPADASDHGKINLVRQLVPVATA